MTMRCRSPRMTRELFIRGTVLTPALFYACPIEPSGDRHVHAPQANRNANIRQCAGRPYGKNAGAGTPPCERPSTHAAIPGGDGTGGVWYGLLLGRGAQVLATARRLHHRRRLRWWPHAEPDL